jgi:hypothetical protein
MELSRPVRVRPLAAGAVLAAWTVVLVITVGPLGSAAIASASCGTMRPESELQLAVCWVLLTALTAAASGVLWAPVDTPPLRSLRRVGFGLLVCAFFGFAVLGGLFVLFSGELSDGAPSGSAVLSAGWFALPPVLTWAAFMSPRLLKLSDVHAAFATALAAAGLSAAALGAVAATYFVGC